MFFKRKTLDTILSAFDKIAEDLHNHIDIKASAAFELHCLRDEIDSEIKAVSEEVDRAGRVLAKVAEFVA